MAETIISPGVFQRENDISFIQPAPVEAGAAILGPTVKGPVEIPTVVTSYNEYVRIFGETFENTSSIDEYFTSIAVKNYFSQGGNNVLVTRVVTGTYTSAVSTHISASDNGSTQPFTISTLGKGASYNNATASAGPTVLTDGFIESGSKDNLRWEVSNVNTGSGTFSLSIRRGDDSNKSKVVLESYANLSLDPNSSDYIEKRVGNQYQALSSDATQVVTYGDEPNRSNYIYVSAVNSKTLNYLKEDGVTLRVAASTGSLPAVGSGSFYNASGAAKASGSMNLYGNINNTDTQGITGSDYTNVITLLGNKDDYKFNIISAPGLAYNYATHATPLNSIISLAETRGDAIAVVDLDGYGSTVATQNNKAAGLNSSYAASYWPWLQTPSANGKNVWAPASVFVPGAYAFTDGANAPWFAPAGLVRGGLAGVIQAEKKLAKADRDSLYNAKVNPIATFPGTGIAIFGQKTLQTKSSALDRVNVRRLLIELKEFIGNQAQSLVFEQNTIATRNRFLANVNPFLDSVVQRQGLYAYRVVMDDTNNTADVVDRNQLVGQIFVQPTKTAEFIILDFVVEPTGATFGN